MTVALSPVAIQDFFINGIPATGGKLFVYAAGTTNKITTYTDSTGNTAQTNPIIMNSRGEPENTGGASVGIWVPVGTAYKLEFSPSTDTDPPTNPIWTVDNSNATAAATTVFDLPFEFLGGTPPGSLETMGAYVALRAQTFYANFNGVSAGGVAAQGACRVKPSATFTMTLYTGVSPADATVQVGTIAVATNGVFTFATTGGTSFNLPAGSWLKIVAPVSADATIADITLTLPGFDQ